MLVRPASRRDDEGIWRIMEPIIRAGETYPLGSDMSKADALNYWYGPEDEVFVVEAVTRYLALTICALIRQEVVRI